MLKAEPELAAKEIAKRLEISPRAVEKQISRLRKEALLRRIGPAKGEH
jgi:ATP-dependent DNA helicase RecG